MMKLISRLFLGIIKGIVLLIGIAMLVSGGFCSAYLPIAAFSQRVIIMKEMMLFLVLFIISVGSVLGGYFLVSWIVQSWQKPSV